MESQPADITQFFLGQALTDIELRKKYGSVIEAEKGGRRSSLRLYDDVFQTLWHFKNSGIRIIAYTDSMSLYTKERLVLTGLDGLIDVVYTPVPPFEDIESIFKEAELLSVDDLPLLVTKIKTLGEHDHKPNPAALLDIIKDQGLEREECIYVGDSLDRDIAMAQEAGVRDVWAQYGKNIDPIEYDLLKKVTHWPAQNVSRESEYDEGKIITPTFTISSIAQLKNIIDVGNFASKIDNTELDIWKKAVDVQMHFNDMGMKVRHMYFTILAALIAFYGVIIRHTPSEINIDGVYISYSLIILLTISIITYLFYFVDRYWYHRLLIGSVLAVKDLEEKFKRRNYPSLGHSISERSPVEYKFPLNLLKGWIITDKKDDGMIHSDGKIELLYRFILVFSVLLFFIKAFFGGISWNSEGHRSDIYSLVIKSLC